MLLSSSILCLSVSSSASCLALSAASMSFLAVWELSDSWEPASHGQNVIRGQKSRMRVGCGPVFGVCVCVRVQARLGRIKRANTCQPDRMFTGKWMEHFDKEIDIQWCLCVFQDRSCSGPNDAYPRRNDVVPWPFKRSLLGTRTPPNLFMLSMRLLFYRNQINIVKLQSDYCPIKIIPTGSFYTRIKCKNHFNCFY